MTTRPSECARCELTYFTDVNLQIESAFLKFTLDNKADVDVLLAKFVMYIDTRMKDIHKDHG